MPTPLLRNGTIIRGGRDRLLGGGKYIQIKSSESAPDHATPNDQTVEVAHIEEATVFVEGSLATMTITFRAGEEEDIEPACPPDTGYIILGVDDSQVYRRFLARIMSRFGQDITTVSNGLEAVDLYKANPERYPCILMDIHMPVMDGVEATRQIRAFEASQPDLRRSMIVGMGARDTNIDPELPSVDFDCTMQKPFYVKTISQLFLSGPQTNLVFRYGCLTEQEMAAYPRRMQYRSPLGDDPRTNAIIRELPSLCEPLEESVLDIRVIVRVVK